MRSICLCMIVKNEATIIERCLESTSGLIDSWVICDTGSSDGTQELIERKLQGIPGELHRRQWRNFGHNRSELLEFATGHGDYLLLLDADMAVTYDRSALADLSADCYLLRHAEPIEYWVARLIKSDRSWRYVGSTHEYLMSDEPTQTRKLRSIVVHHYADGASRSVKYERDLRLLAEDLQADPSDPRTVFYLAQTYRDLGRHAEAIEHYDRRAAMGGWDEEVFYSKFQAGLLRAETGDWPQAVTDLVAAWEFRPSRLEPVYELASRFRLRGEYETAHLFAQEGVYQSQPDDILFVSPWVYRWGLLFEYSITSYWVGDPEAASLACRQLLQLPDLPDNYRKQTVTNLSYCVKKVSEGHNARAAGLPSAQRAGKRRRR